MAMGREGDDKAIWRVAARLFTLARPVPHSDGSGQGRGAVH